MKNPASLLINACENLLATLSSKSLPVEPGTQGDHDLIQIAHDLVRHGIGMHPEWIDSARPKPLPGTRGPNASAGQAPRPG
ncbi:hypothetical protein MPNT_10120 [Candidatus Methylacidithermus pantelleriae]|uniref:Uncharacterized protein n=1 Tax=Candidatus Methylacidithermus pantelleriae TaxID=2744239 RepID=A0A8J2FMK8_9BACT|nr:hypothetical protein MPNT_10120 [Candidatus Methylacidithermus pantelleriae]